MKYKVKLAALSVMLCANAIADPVYLPPGSNLTYGSSSNNQSIMSSITNPAAAAAQLSKEDGQYRIGLISIGGGYEFGNVNDLYTKIDAQKTTLQTPAITQLQLATAYFNACGITTCTAAQATAFATSVSATINAGTQVAAVNTVLAALQQDGYASVYVGGHIPLTPFVVTKKGLGGSFVLDANVSVIANLSFIEDPLAITATTVGPIATAYQTYVAGGAIGTFTPPPISNDSTLLVKAAMVAELGLGYSRPVLNRANGDLTAGVRAKYYQVKLDRSPQKLVNSTGSKNTLNASKTYASSSGIGLDVGTLWTAKRYRVGAWVNNLNTPSFKYNDLTAAELTAAGYTTTTTASALIYNQLASGLTYEMKPQLQLEGAVFSESQNWVLNAGLDGNAVQDPVGRDFQWATLSAAYATDSWWIPGARVGYRSNRAGSKLSYLTGGLTLFKALSLDIAYGLDKITDNNGKSIPRSAMINLGLQMTF